MNQLHGIFPFSGAGDGKAVEAVDEAAGDDGDSGFHQHGGEVLPFFAELIPLAGDHQGGGEILQQGLVSVDR